MQPVSLIKRVLYYIFLSLISFTTMIIGGLFALADPSDPSQDYRTTHYFPVILIIFVFLIPQYVFGLIFLKTKWIYKLIVPLATAIITFGCLRLLGDTGFFKWLGYPLFLLVLPVVFSWEIAYQILKSRYNRLEHTANNDENEENIIKE
jgi:hypothetical protein